MWKFILYKICTDNLILQTESDHAQFICSAYIPSSLHKNPILCCSIWFCGLKSILKPKSVSIPWTVDMHLPSIKNMTTICSFHSHKSRIKKGVNWIKKNLWNVSSFIFCIFVHGTVFYCLSIHLSVEETQQQHRTTEWLECGHVETLPGVVTLPWIQRVKNTLSCWL